MTDGLAVLKSLLPQVGGVMGIPNDHAAGLVKITYIYNEYIVGRPSESVVFTIFSCPEQLNR